MGTRPSRPPFCSASVTSVCVTRQMGGTGASSSIATSASRRRATLKIRAHIVRAYSPLRGEECVVRVGHDGGLVDDPHPHARRLVARRAQACATLIMNLTPSTAGDCGRRTDAHRA